MVPFIALCLLTGCLARPPLEKQSFILAPPPPTLTPTTGSQSHRVLGIRSLQVSETFAGRSFVYRTGEFSYAGDPYAEFTVRPADGFLQPIATWFRQSGGFSAVADLGSALKPDTLVEIQVLQLYGDFRTQENAAAVMALRLVFFDAPKGIPGEVLMQREYSRNVPLKARAATALIEGWNEALAQILDLAVRDLSQVDTKPPQP